LVNKFQIITHTIGEHPNNARNERSEELFDKDSPSRTKVAKIELFIIIPQVQFYKI
jgi:hypothetical protein